MLFVSSLKRPLTGWLSTVHFPRPFWFLVSGSFLNKAGNFVMPFFTLYLTTVQHLSISVTTVVISCMGIGSLAAGICGGMLADLFGRRLTILFSLLATGTLMVALGFAQTIPLILLLAVPYQFCNESFRPATSAAIADLVPAQEQAQAYSLRYWANNIGNAIGPLIAGLIAPVSYLLLFLVDALTTYSFSVLIWVGVPETSPRKRATWKKHQKLSTQEALPMHKALTDLRLWVYAVLALLFDCVYLQWATVLPLDMHAHGINTLGFGTVVALNAVEIVVISLPLTAFFQRHNLHLSLVVAALLLGIGMGLYGWLPTYPGYLLGALIWTMGEMLSYPMATALIAELAPRSLRGSYQGIYSTIRATAAVVAPALGGLLLESLGSSVFWGCCLLAGTLIACGYLGTCFAFVRNSREDIQRGEHYGNNSCGGGRPDHS
jgi:MFS family permease